jgi:hypothetical protein
MFGQLMQIHSLLRNAYDVATQLYDPYAVLRCLPALDKFTEDFPRGPAWNLKVRV